MRLLVTGASGLIGSALVRSLADQHEVVRLTRSEPQGTGEFRWDPMAGEIDPEALEGVDAVVHLAGETVAGRWTKSKKRAHPRQPRARHAPDRRDRRGA